MAKETVKDIIDRYGAGNRFGIMIFHDNASEDSNGGYFPGYGEKYPVCEVKDTFILDGAGNLKTGAAYEAAIQDYKTYLKNLLA